MDSKINGDATFYPPTFYPPTFYHPRIQVRRFTPRFAFDLYCILRGIKSRTSAIDCDFLSPIENELRMKQGDKKS